MDGGGGLRYRGGGPDEQSSGTSTVERVLGPLRSLDAFPKKASDAHVKTEAGGALSITVFVLLFLLVVSETRDYFKKETRQDLGVDFRKSDFMNITMDISFYEADCRILEIHSVDNAEQAEHSVEENIAKITIDTQTLRTLDEYEAFAAKGMPACGPCSGVRPIFKWKRNPNEPCCNNCDAVRTYQQQRVGVDEGNRVAAESEQCVAEKMLHDASRKKGCRVTGRINVPKVSGNFHFGLVNTSHMIHDLHIARLEDANAAIGGIPTIHHVNKIAKEPSTFFRYFMKIVPTVKYRTLTEPFVGEEGYDFSLTQSERVERRRFSRMNGVFFVYELSPFALFSYPVEKPFGHFLVNICAIVGGLFTVFGLTDAIVHQGFARFFKLDQLAMPQ